MDMKNVRLAYCAFFSDSVLVTDKIAFFPSDTKGANIFVFVCVLVFPTHPVPLAARKKKKTGRKRSQGM